MWPFFMVTPSGDTHSGGKMSKMNWDAMVSTPKMSPRIVSIQIAFYTIIIIIIIIIIIVFIKNQ